MSVLQRPEGTVIGIEFMRPTPNGWSGFVAPLAETTLMIHPDKVHRCMLQTDEADKIYRETKMLHDYSVRFGWTSPIEKHLQEYITFMEDNNTLEEFTMYWKQERTKRRDFLGQLIPTNTDFDNFIEYKARAAETPACKSKIKSFSGWVPV